MDGTTTVAVAASSFVGTHFLLSHPLRAPLVKALGNGGFTIVYALVAFATLGWMANAYKAAPITPMPVLPGRVGVAVKVAVGVDVTLGVDVEVAVAVGVKVAVLVELGVKVGVTTAWFGTANTEYITAVVAELLPPSVTLPAAKLRA